MYREKVVSATNKHYDSKREAMWYSVPPQQIKNKVLLKLYSLILNYYQLFWIGLILPSNITPNQWSLVLLQKKTNSFQCLFDVIWKPTLDKNQIIVVSCLYFSDFPF